MRRIVLNIDTKGESISEYFGQLSLREKIKTAVQIIFPPKRYIRQHYSIRAKRATAPYYIYRIVSYIIQLPFMIIRWAISLLRRST